MRLMHWNILAQKLCNKDAFYLKHHDAKVLTWDKRFPLIKEQITKYKPDILGMCELDTLYIQNKAK